ncbi:MAG: ATP-binding protein, partial [Nitrospinales bacterium]
MKKPTSYWQNIVEKQKRRIEYLEQSNKWHLFALEALASLGELHGDAEQNRDPAFIFATARKHLKRLVDFRTLAFFTVHEFDSSFKLADCEPTSDQEPVHQSVGRQIENGTFAWALKQNRALIVKDDPSGDKLLMNVLSGKSRVLGMFVGRMRTEERKIPADRLTLISIVLHNTATALENAALYKLLQDQNRKLDRIAQKRAVVLKKQTIELKDEINERNRAVNALENLNGQNESILISAGDGIFGLDLEGNITFANPVGAQMSGRQAGELIGQPIQALLSPAASDKPAQSRQISPIQKALRNNVSCYVPYGKFWRKDGAHFPVGYTCIPTQKGDAITGAVVSFRNLADRQRADQELKFYAAELQRSNQELQDFASIASHDLKEPLRKVITFSDRLKSEYSQALDARGKDYLVRMQKAVGRMQQFIDDLLQYSKVHLKARPFETVDLGEVVGEVCASLERRIVQTGGRVEAKPLPVIDADRMQMRQLFRNLISNALKFHRKDAPPVVTLSSQLCNGGLVEIVVEDNGIGFDNKHAGQIFKPFERLHGRGEYEGSGMGLAICRKIAARHGGTI